MIKIIAFISMFADHVGQLYFPNLIIFSIIGRLAFPIFAWGIAIGLRRTTDFNKYAFRLFLLAIISEIPHYYLFESNYLNVCFTLLNGLLILRLFQSKLSIIKWPIITILLILSEALNMEYGIYGILMIVIFYMFENRKYLMLLLQAGVTIFSIYQYNYSIVQLFAVASLLIILLLKKYDFKINRYLQYTFYPVHMLILLIVTYIIPKY